MTQLAWKRSDRGYGYICDYGIYRFCIFAIDPDHGIYDLWCNGKFIREYRTLAEAKAAAQDIYDYW